ncbi:MAG: ribonuclease H family protein [Paludibacteraceae bacterium]|nr:ribonuclease H family protein [Paludibacteraceae bacterium]
MSKNKFYTVWKGNTPGVYNTWKECEAQVKGVEGAQYKAFATRQEAENALKQNYWQCIKAQTAKTAKPTTHAAIITDSLAVDAACSGNPGDMEYRGVYVKTGQQIFIQGVYKEATNNIGEFLAIVHGLALLKKQGSNMPIYSDSVTAQAWVKAKKCKTKLEKTPQNALVFERIEAAERWLQNNTYSNPILKWDTPNWGEIPADFGRK